MFSAAHAAERGDKSVLQGRNGGSHFDATQPLGNNAPAGFGVRDENVKTVAKSLEVFDLRALQGHCGLGEIGGSDLEAGPAKFGAEGGG
jgi:hypothetical protein